MPSRRKCPWRSRIEGRPAGSAGLRVQGDQSARPKLIDRVYACIHTERAAHVLFLFVEERLDALTGPVTPFTALPEAMPRLLNPPPGEPPPLCPIVLY